MKENKQEKEEENKRKRKRVQAIYELYMSESNYVYDLLLWTRTIRHLVVNTTNLTLYSKHIFITTILMNAGNILEIHIKILQDIEKTLNIDKKTDRTEYMQSEVTEQ